MKPYDEYKPGPEWMGKVPAHWEVKKTKYLYRMVCDFAPKDNGMELLSVYTNIGVRPRRTLEQKGNRASTTDGYWMVQKQDIIVNKLLAWMGAIGISKFDGVTSPAYDILRPLGGVHSDYYDLIFRSGLLLHEFKRRSRGIMDMRLRLYFDEFGQIPLPLPPIDEQTRIVGYLGAKNREIEGYIAAKRALLARLKELSAAVISRAVTRGLNPEVETQASGVEWLGDVPKHWEIKRLKFVVGVNLETLMEETAKDWEIEYVDISSVGTGVLGQTEKMLFGAAPSRARRRIKAGDTIISTVRTYLKAIYSFADAADNLIASTGFAVLTPKRVSSDFLAFAVQSDGFINQVTSNSVGVSYPAITASNLANLKIPLPPLEEQGTIVAFIENQLGTIRDAQTRIEREIELARELWTTLVAEVVMGQIDVREWDGAEEEFAFVGTESDEAEDELILETEEVELEVD